jgi:polyisoprenoid-binding protein YceI
MAQQAPRDSVTYVLLPSSHLDVTTGKAGLLSFAGHEHTIRAHAASGSLIYRPAAPAASRVTVVVPTDSLEVLTPPDTEEIRKVTAAMRADVLHVERFPEIRLVSRSMIAIPQGYRVVADLTMHGQTHPVTLDARVEHSGDTMRVRSAFAVRQTAFGMTPYRGGPGGTVRVADRVQFTIDARFVRRQ